MFKYFVMGIFLAHSALASADYCVDQYDGQITKVNTELGTLLKRQAEIDTRVAQIYVSVSKLSKDLADAAKKVPPDTGTIQRLGEQIADLDREKTLLEAEGYKNQDRAGQLKGVVPAELQGKLRGCVEATAPTNRLVNLAIQTIAIVSTGGAAVNLPPKALYVDMGAVLNGYPTGGSTSVINEAREAALRALPGGLGSDSNDVGKFLRNPVGVISCIFGCS
uniref:Uncharacterized protein n=1 Tax=Ralstonia solanacearum TaxID=305 RepID=A0A0S4VBF0_RALSL|nr:exported protein of unknown function [Ralstonia solanacearum]